MLNQSPTQSAKRFWSYSVFYIVLLLALSVWFYQKNQAVSIVSPALNPSKTIQCVSYSPYYGKAQSPLVLGIKISPAQIDADLKKLSHISDCVRTYSVGQGMDYVPEAAQKIGLKVYLGAWVGWINTDNEAEIKLAVKRANEYPNTIKGLIIGNEVFLRQEQKQAVMIRYLSYAKSHTKTPITYADVWEFWIKNKNMEKYVDFVTVHILPYWENNPVAAEDGVMHASNIMTKLGTVFTKPILIGETGWPSIGRQRNASKPGLVNQARYIREFLQTAHDKNWQYNIIEAVDQPWKRNLEGTVGGYWGLYNTDLTQKFSLTAPVAERHDGYTPVYLALIGALLWVGILLFKYPPIKHPPSAGLLVSAASLGALAGLIGLLQYEYLISACRNGTEWLALGSAALLGWLIVVLDPLHIIRQGSASGAMIRASRYGLMLAAIVASYLIYVDGRYRDYPNLIFVLPIIVLSGGVLLNYRTLISSSQINYFLCPFVVILSLLCLSEEPNNLSASVWFVLNCLMAITLWPRQKSISKPTPSLS
ncbi:MAG: beta (1-6) glucan synthase [Methylophilaceae bacterium]